MNETDFEPDSVNAITQDPALTPAQKRLQEDTKTANDAVPVYVTDDGYPTSLDHAPDISDAGWFSNGSVDGLGADLDTMPGDETPLRPARKDAMGNRERTPEEETVAAIQTTEQDKEQITGADGPPTEGQPGRTGNAADLDLDSDQTRGASSEPLSRPGG